MSDLVLRADVTIGPLEIGYAPAMYRWMCDPEIRENLGLRNEASLERTQRWIEQALLAEEMQAYAILQADCHVGNVVIDRLDRYIGTGRLSVYVGEGSARGMGVGATGMYLAMARAFGELRLHKIWLTVHAQNYRAMRTYASLGFALEGILRDECWLRGERMDALYMGVLATDFERLVVTWR